MTKVNPTRIYMGAVSDNGVQALLVERSLKLLNGHPLGENGFTWITQTHSFFKGSP